MGGIRYFYGPFKTFVRFYARVSVRVPALMSFRKKHENMNDRVLKFVQY